MGSATTPGRQDGASAKDRWARRARRRKWHLGDAIDWPGVLLGQLWKNDRANPLWQATIVPYQRKLHQMVEELFTLAGPQRVGILREHVVCVCGKCTERELFAVHYVMVHGSSAAVPAAAAPVDVHQAPAGLVQAQPCANPALAVSQETIATPLRIVSALAEPHPLPPWVHAVGSGLVWLSTRLIALVLLPLLHGHQLVRGRSR